jgi:hypothetical protein
VQRAPSSVEGIVGVVGNGLARDVGGGTRRTLTWIQPFALIGSIRETAAVPIVLAALLIRRRSLPRLSAIAAVIATVPAIVAVSSVVAISAVVAVSSVVTISAVIPIPAVVTISPVIAISATVSEVTPTARRRTATTATAVTLAALLKRRTALTAPLRRFTALLRPRDGTLASAHAAELVDREIDVFVTQHRRL